VTAAAGHHESADLAIAVAARRRRASVNFAGSSVAWMPSPSIAPAIRTVTVPGAVAGQSARFRVIGADQQSFALRRLPGLAAAGQAAVVIVCDLSTAFVIGIAILMIVPGRLQDLPVGILLLVIGLWSLWMVATLHFRRPVVSVTPSELRAGRLGPRFAGLVAVPP
jgi:hypothetical protein